jgi:membrane protease YdiL (CAAX protease family)
MSDETAAEIPVVETAGVKCSNCEAPFGENDRFCRVCGAQLAPAEDENAANKKWNAIRQLILFFIIEVIICACSDIKACHTFGWLLFFDAIFAVTAVTFVSLNWNVCRPLLRWNNFSVGRLALYCLLAVLASCAISFIVDWLNEGLFSKRESYYLFFSSRKHGILLAIIFIAVMPAIFEELAFRVFLLGKLLTVLEKNQAMFISAFMFGIMHMSFISLFWLIPFGLWLAYVRMRQNTMWYGSCIHFCFNFTVCISEIWQATYHH